VRGNACQSHGIQPAWPCVSGRRWRCPRHDTADNIDIAATNPQVRLRLQAELAPAMAGVRAGTLPFAGADCQRLSDRVMERLGLA
jgi:hypothetical protein